MKKLLLTTTTLLVLAATALQLRRAFGALPFEFSPNWYTIVPALALAGVYGALKGRKHTASTAQTPVETIPAPAYSTSCAG